MHAAITTLAREATGKPLLLTRSMPVTDDVVLHRFALGDNPDWLYMLIDGTGAFELIRYPGTDDARTVKRGRLADFPAALALA